MYFKVTNTESLFKMFDVIKLFTKTASDFFIIRYIFNSNFDNSFGIIFKFPFENHRLDING